MDYNNLELALLEIGFEKYRARQVFKWLHQKFAGDFSEMTDLPKNFRSELARNFFIRNAEIVKKLSDGDATKYLLKVGNSSIIERGALESATNNSVIIESVTMKYNYGVSVCVSTQAGCRMGCAFCVSGKSFEGNLTAAQMESQIAAAKNDSQPRSLVLMGTGEPLDNFANVVDFINIITDPNGLGMSERKITLSTCGLADKIIELADLKKQISLAVSLHAPNDEIRRSLMPAAKKYKIKDVLAASDYYYKKTKRRVTFEYSLVSGINDSDGCAEELASKLKNAHVNLINVNENEEFKRSPRIKKFAEILKRRGVNATVRREMGTGINAACGQLKASLNF